MERLLFFVMAILGVDFAQAQADESCACLWQGSFAEVAPNSDAVVLGKVVAVKGNAVDLALEAQLRGNIYFDPIRIWMKAKNYCRPEVSRFTEGSRWIFALDHIDAIPDGGFDPLTPNISYGRKGDWQLSSCGGYFLAVTGETARGNLVPSMARWDYTPKMQPVLVDLIRAYVDGRADLADLQTAVAEDPALKALKLNTRGFLRGQEDFLPADESSSAEPAAEPKSETKAEAEATIRAGDSPASS